MCNLLRRSPSSHGVTGSAVGCLCTVGENRRIKGVLTRLYLLDFPRIALRTLRKLVQKHLLVLLLVGEHA